MEKKTSSVEWLVEQLKNGCDTAKSIRENIQQAKEMHREEIYKAVSYGMAESVRERYSDKKLSLKPKGEEQQYYNETYGSTKQD